MLSRGRVTVAGVRGVAAFELAKGLLVVAVGLGLLALVHRDAQAAAESLVRELHLNPARHYPRVFIDAAGRLTDRRLLLLALGAFAYSALRLAEAVGLWFMRHWAEWISIVSTGIYLPAEAFELVHRPSFIRGAVFATNLLILLGMVYVRFAVPDEELVPVRVGPRRGAAGDPSGR
jgi:uncharacterized membrane protein (DUF2068 family)